MIASLIDDVKADLMYYHNGTIGEIKKCLGPKHFLRAYIDIDFRILFYWRLCIFFSSKKLLKMLAILIFFRLKSRYGVDLSPWAIVDPGIRLMHAFGIVVGPNVYVKKGTKIFHHVTLGKSRPDKEALLMPTIGRYCILGAGAKILGPVNIPDRSLVPANMLITGKKLSQGREHIPAASSDWCDHVELVLSRSNSSKARLQ